MQEVSL